MKKRVSADSTVVAAPSQVSADLAGERAILHLDSGVYYGLDKVGASIWAFIQKPKKVSDILRMLLERYDVEPRRCRQDLLVLLEKLSAEKLVEIRKP